jgi:hypothetical protein
MGKASNTTQSIKAFRNIHEGKRAFVIGNGPSLLLEDLNLLKNEITFGCNRIYLAFTETSWRPTYYTVEDHLVAQQSYQSIENIKDVVKFFPHTLAAIHGLQFSRNIEYPFIWKDVYPELPGFSIDAEKGLHWGSTVAYTMMQMAFFMGIREIFLLGVDLCFTVPEKCASSTGKFKVYICEGEVNHFHPDYRKPGELWHEPNLAYAEKSFLAAARFIENTDQKIYNATCGGNLSIFPRVQLETVLRSS